MIIQNVLNWVTGIVIGFIDGLPEPPAGYYPAIGNVIDALNDLSSAIAPLGVLIPWNAVNSVVAMILTIIPIWIACVPIRGILWVVGR